MFGDAAQYRSDVQRDASGTENFALERKMVPSPTNDENPANDDALLLPHATQIGICGGPDPLRIVSYRHHFEGRRTFQHEIYKILFELNRRSSFSTLDR